MATPVTFSLDPNHMFAPHADWQVRTSDNVRLKLEGTIFWQANRSKCIGVSLLKPLYPFKLSGDLVANQKEDRNAMFAVRIYIATQKIGGLICLPVQEPR